MLIFWLYALAAPGFGVSWKSIHAYLLRVNDRAESLHQIGSRRMLLFSVTRPCTRTTCDTNVTSADWRTATRAKICCAAISPFSVRSAQCHWNLSWNWSLQRAQQTCMYRKTINKPKLEYSFIKVNIQVSIHNNKRHQRLCLQYKKLFPGE